MSYWEPLQKYMAATPPTRECRPNRLVGVVEGVVDEGIAVSAALSVLGSSCLAGTRVASLVKTLHESRVDSHVIMCRFTGSSRRPNKQTHGEHYFLSVLKSNDSAQKSTWPATNVVWPVCISTVYNNCSPRTALFFSRKLSTDAAF